MGKRIIIADDSRTARMFIKQCFEIAGFTDCQFLEAGDGVEALRYLEAPETVDLIVTDLNMPNKDGVELLKAVKMSPKWNKLPVIVITSTKNESKEAILKDLGVFAIIGKPVTPAKVADFVKTLPIK